ncbi:MAG: polymer-forming cytoskeletal protein [bacterium]|nr:polymer-forming cytoskeletal protein [bacterium]
MAMFSNDNDQKSNNETDTIIGSSVKVDGNFKSNGNIIVEGMVQGSIKTKSNLTIGQDAKIKAEVEANNLYLSGEIKGNVKVFEKAELKSNARVLGNLETKLLSVEEGAIINGKCTMLAESIEPEIKENKKNQNQK